MIKQLLFFCVAVSILIGCQEGDSNISALKSLEKEIKKNPTSDNYTRYFSKATQIISDNKSDSDYIKPILERVVDFAKANNQDAQASAFLMPLIKDYKDDSKHKVHLLELAELMHRNQKDHAAISLYAGYKEQYPNSKSNTDLESLLANLGTPLISYIDTMFNRVFTDPDEFGLNRNNALLFVDMAEAFALANPSSNRAPYYLYKAGEIARSIRTLPKALSIYDWILDDYPAYEKTPTVLFLKGFILENDIEDPDNAKIMYEQFLQQYPDHELASSVKFLLENLGRSDEEILEFIESQRDK